MPPPAPKCNGLHTRRQQQLQDQIEAGLRLDRWALCIAGTFGLLVLLAYGYQGWFLRDADRAVREARRDMGEAEVLLRDLYVLRAGAPITPAGYFVVYRQQTVVYQRREHFNRVVARYNRAAALPYGAWWCVRLQLPRQHVGVRIGD